MSRSRVFILPELRWSPHLDSQPSAIVTSAHLQKKKRTDKPSRTIKKIKH